MGLITRGLGPPVGVPGLEKGGVGAIFMKDQTIFPRIKIGSIKVKKKKELLDIIKIESVKLI